MEAKEIIEKMEESNFKENLNGIFVHENFIEMLVILRTRDNVEIMTMAAGYKLTPGLFYLKDLNSNTVQINQENIKDIRMRTERGPLIIKLRNPEEVHP
jgi:hypothetical protein